MENSSRFGDICSPCVKFCKLNQDNSFCLGCYRETQEIANWRKFSGDERRAVMNKILIRRGLFKNL